MIKNQGSFKGLVTSILQGGINGIAYLSFGPSIETANLALWNSGMNLWALHGSRLKCYDLWNFVMLPVKSVDRSRLIDSVGTVLHWSDQKNRFLTH